MRFSGFTDEWNEVTLNDVATFSKGKGISKNDISNYGIECVRYGELYTKYNEMIYNIESKTDLNKNELKLSEKNDILMPCSGETAIDLATASCIQKDQVAIGGDITVIKTNQYAPFITYYLNQKKTEIAKYAQGVSIVHLYPKDFKVMNIRIPSINEQKMIIGLLEEITKKEQLLESKYQQYQEFKKYLMQQIFTQKLRFNFTDEWEKYLLGDISLIGKGFTPSTSNPSFWDGDLKWLSIADMNQGKYINQTTKKITSDGSKNKEPVKKGTLLMSFKLSIGKLGILTEDMYTNEAICNFKWKNKDVLTEYMYYYLSSINILKYGSQAAKGITLNNETLSTIPVLLPSLEEQKKIINILSDVDMKINMLENSINDTSKFKKGLLQQMFIVRINWRCNFKLAKSPSFNKHLLILKNKIIFIIIK